MPQDLQALGKFLMSDPDMDAVTRAEGVFKIVEAGCKACFKEAPPLDLRLQMTPSQRHRLER